MTPARDAEHRLAQPSSSLRLGWLTLASIAAAAAEGTKEERPAGRQGFCFAPTKKTNTGSSSLLSRRSQKAFMVIPQSGKM